MPVVHLTLDLSFPGNMRVLIALCVALLVSLAAALPGGEGNLQPGQNIDKGTTQQVTSMLFL
jgi:hypothetical protein